MASVDARRQRLRVAGVVAQWLLMIGTAIAIGWIIWSRRGDFERLLSLDLTTFALMSVSGVIAFILNGIEMKVLVRKFGTHIPFGETTRLGLMVSTLNYLPMKTGTLLLGVVMKARHKVQLADFAALIAGSTVMYLWVSCTFAGAFRMLAGSVDVFSWLLLVVPTVAVAGLVAWGRYRREGRDRSHMPRIARVVLRAIDGLGLFFSDPVLLAKDLAINVALLGLASFEIMMALHALSTPVGWGKAVAITGIANFVARLSIVPGGLGFREGAAAAGAVAVGLTATLGLGAAMVDRAVSLVWLLILGVPATLYVQRDTGLRVRMSLTGGEVTGQGPEAADMPAAKAAGPGEAP